MPIVGVWLLLYGSYTLVRPPLPDGPGAMHAEIAREMATRHDWTTPYANGVPVHSSSKALDWSIAASYQLFAVRDWSARLPIAFCVLALGILVFFFCRELSLRNAGGLYASLIVLAWPGTFLATRDLTAVPYLCLETTGIAFLLWHLLVVRRLAGFAGIAISLFACPLMLLTGDWPAMVLPAAISAACWLARRRERSKQPEVVLIAWAATAFLFADLFEAQPRNMPAWIGPAPPLAMLFGGLLAGSDALTDRKTTRTAAMYIFAASLPIGAIAVFLALHGPVAFNLWKRSFFITGGADRIPLLIVAAALIAGATGNLLFRLRGRALAANCFLAGMLAGVTASIQAALVIDSPAVSSQILADAIRPELDPTDIVAIDGKYPDASSFAFYLERPVQIALPAAAKPPGSVSSLPIGVVAIDQIWTGSERVYLWTRTDRPLAVTGPSYIVASSGGKEILSNRPNAAGAAF